MISYSAPVYAAPIVPLPTFRFRISAFFRVSVFGLRISSLSHIMPDPTLILNAPAIQRALTRIAHEIAERNEAGSEVVVVGIQRGGVPLGQRLGDLLTGIWGQPVPTGSLDVSMHRDDLDQRVAPNVQPTGHPVRCDRQDRRAGG